MNAGGIDWSSGLLVLAVGLVLGALFVWRARQAQKAAPHAADTSLALRDLHGRRDALIAQLRELSDAAAKHTPEQLRSERGTLELELARVLKALDESSSESRPKGQTRSAASEPEPRASNTGLRGFLWGVGSMAALGGLFLWVSRTAEPRKEGGALTGTTPSMGAPAAEATPEPTEAERKLRAVLERSPEDLETRVALTRELLGRGDMMGVWNETQEILKRKPDEPRALSYQALVRLAMGQGDVALQMLQRALKADPDQVEVYTHLAFVYLNAGRPQDAEQIMATARKRFPDEAPRLSEVFAHMKERVQAQAASAQTGGEENPHAKLKEPDAGQENPHAKLGQGKPAEAPPAAPAPAATTAATPQTQGDPKRRVAGTIELDAAQAARVQSGATLFLVARPAGVTAGPPVGVRRLVVASFPMAFELSDGDSMTGAPLPDSLRIEARVDSDGDAATKDPSDPKGTLEGVALGSGGLKLLLK